MSVSIQELPPESRPRERLLQNGPGVLSDTELLALLLGSGRSGASSIEVAGELLARFGSLREAGLARAQELTLLKSVGPAKAASLMAAFELGRRAAQRNVPSLRINGPAEIAAAAATHVSDPRREEVFVVALSAGNRLRRVERIGVGGDSSCRVEVREILGVAFRFESPAFGLVHTHPSGDLKPSAADVSFTIEVRNAAHQLGIRLLDHVIVAGTRWASLRELGHLA